MIKGCQKKIIYLKSPDGSVFEEAYFILRPECDEKQLNEKDMVKEAERIIDGASKESPAADGAVGTVKREKRTSFFLFFGGAAAATALFALIKMCSAFF